MWFLLVLEAKLGVENNPPFNFNNDYRTVTQVYKLMSNEYRYFPIRYGINACKAIAANVMGIHKILECGNFTGCRGVEKGKTYHICNWTIDESKYPPRMPRGSYMVEVTVMYHEEEVGVINGFGEVLDLEPQIFA
ncbi:hypothetical protein ILUMI_13002 [Ignelater luminosus]|uniref:Uncharacterized protein n=1 Tax=Ignelater luminosus TaxID=2038154 RepID=A0A8K0GCE6_IGNLU|nr:hypothetical protein ILUMI_13002 [Ignelater luminosus]